MDETYDITKLIPFRKVSFWQRFMLRSMVLFYVPIVLWESYLRRRDRNPLHDGRRKLTGEKRVAISKEFDFATIKKTSRSLNTTINELLISSLQVTVAQLFKDRGDEKNKRFRIAMPCNIRWKQYDTYEEVKMENRFAPMPLKVALTLDRMEALQKAKKVSGDMKRQFSKVYAIYFLSLVFGYVIPVFF